MVKEMCCSCWGPGLVASTQVKWHAAACNSSFRVSNTFGTHEHPQSCAHTPTQTHIIISKCLKTECTGSCGATLFKPRQADQAGFHREFQAYQNYTVRSCSQPKNNHNIPRLHKTKQTLVNMGERANIHYQRWCNLEKPACERKTPCDRAQLEGFLLGEK